MTLQTSTSTPDATGSSAQRPRSYLDEARRLAPLIESEAPRAEAEHDVTEVVGQAFRDAGLYWMLVPERFGGGGLSVTAALEVIEEIARADGSTGWMIMATAVGTRHASAYLPESTSRSLLGGDDKAILAGFAGPVGTARRVEGGYLANAPLLPFGSGSTYCTHLSGGFRVVDDEGAPVLGPTGAPEVITAYVPKADAEMLGNWDVMGLKATGSYDYAIREQFIPDALAGLNPPPVPAGEATPGRIMDRTSLGVAGHGAVALGLMKRALQEVAGIVSGRRRANYPVDVDRHPLFLASFGEMEVAYQAARSHFLSVCQAVEDAARERGSASASEVQRIRQASTWTHQVADRIVAQCVVWAAGQAFRNPSALGRVSRDMTVAKCHLLVDPITMVAAAEQILPEWRTTE